MPPYAALCRPTALRRTLLDRRGGRPGERVGSAINHRYSTLTICHLADTWYASLDVAMPSGRYGDNVLRQE